MTGKIVFSVFTEVDHANNYCKKPSKVIASTVAPMLCSIVLLYNYINFHHLAEHFTINSIANKHNH